VPRRKRHEEHENHEAWAIPYGDLVTLLLAFFVVMYAMSSVNEGKYRVLSNSLNEAFNGTPSANSAEPSLEGQPTNIELPLNQVHRLIASALPVSVSMTAPAKPVPTKAGPSTPAATSAVSSASVEADRVRAAQLGEVASQVTSAMGALVAAGEVHVHRYENWVSVDISTDILFGSGVARVSTAAVPALQRLADALKPFPNAIRVEGHTDDRPIQTAEFPSNWELSAARAASVVHLFMDRGIAAPRLAVMGFGQYRPASANDDAVGRNANRRVVVVILGSDIDPSQSAGHL
jgi:chemotaxis protein MotB